MLVASSRLSSPLHGVAFSFCRWVIVPCDRGSPRWSLLVGRPPRLGVSPLLGALPGFITSFGLSLPYASDGASGGVRDFLGLGLLVLVHEVPQILSPGGMPHQCPSMVKLLPSQLPPLLPSLRKPASPPRWSPAFSLSRSPEVPQIFSPCGPPHQCSSVVELPPSRLPPLLPSPSFCTDLPSLHIQLPRLSRGSPHYLASLPLPPVSHALPHIPCVDSFPPALRSYLVSACTPPSSPAQLSGATTRPVVYHSLLDGLLPVAPLLDAELGISLPDALATLKVSLPQEQLDLLRFSFVAVVAPISRSSLARLRRELRRIGASAASILPPGAATAARRTSGFWPNGPVLVTAIYGPCVGALRGQLWAELHQVRQLAASPWLLAGDFNCLLSPADSSSPVSFGQSMSAFRSFVDEFGLFDVPSTNGTFTWSNNRNPPILRRLDRIFLSPELFSAFPSSSLDLGLRHLSDHASLLLSLHWGRAGSGPARFRFELWWLRDESFVATVPIWWARAVNGRWAAFRLSRKH
ncbi:hypothetical protein EJ110_NYTH25044 [Nymphaea thermarum]|nr:hypothetical protein EJ110_NYTH25044 [Nymphaea thermarum]